MAMLSHRLRQALITANSSFNRYVSLTPSSLAPTPAEFPRVAPMRNFSKKLYRNGDIITKDTVLFKGCDYNHWLITMDFGLVERPSPEETVSTNEGPSPEPEEMVSTYEGTSPEPEEMVSTYERPSPEEMVSTYERTCASVLGISLEEAKAKIYACSTTNYHGFQAVMTEEESEKFRGVPGVLFILPDCYLDPVNKTYGGDVYKNGVIEPRPSPLDGGSSQGKLD